MAERTVSKLKYRVVSSFTAAGEGELTITQGELLFASQGGATNGWIFVQTLRGTPRSGYVPVSYLQHEPSQAALAPKRAANPFDNSPTENGKKEPKPVAVTGNGSVPVSNGSNRSVRGEVPEQYRTSHAAKFKKTLEYWRERERRFMAGEEERLPVARRRVYFYWDKNGVRHGPLTEQQMRAKFEQR